HAGAVIAGGKGTAADKYRALERAGVRTVKSPAELGAAMAQLLGRRGTRSGASEAASPRGAASAPPARAAATGKGKSKAKAKAKTKTTAAGKGQARGKAKAQGQGKGKVRGKGKAKTRTA